MSKRAFSIPIFSARNVPEKAILLFVYARTRASILGGIFS